MTDKENEPFAKNPELNQIDNELKALFEEGVEDLNNLREKAIEWHRANKADECEELPDDSMRQINEEYNKIFNGLNVNRIKIWRRLQRMPQILKKESERRRLR